MEGNALTDKSAQEHGLLRQMGLNTEMINWLNRFKLCRQTFILAISPYYIGINAAVYINL